MKVKIEDGCIGCGMCAGTCPSVFRMTDENLVEVFAQPEPSEEAVAQDAADGCPVHVIMTAD